MRILILHAPPVLKTWTLALALVAVVLPVHGTAQPYELTTAEAATNLAQRYHPHTRVLRSEADLARAERSAGRVLPNPEADFVYRKSGSERHWEFGLMGDVNGLLLYPWKRGAASTRYRATTHRLSAEAAAQNSTVRSAWYRAVAAAQTQAYTAQTTGIWDAAAELARRQRSAGTMNALDLAEVEAAAAEARVALRTATTEAFAQREELAGLVGVPAEQLTLPEELPVPTGDDPPPATLESLASSRNAGLAARREEAKAGEAAHTLAWLEVLPTLKAGVSLEQNDAGARAIGPAIAAEIPLFDLGIPARAKTRAERDLGRLRVTAAQLELGPTIRRHHAAMSAARRSYEEITTTLVPLRKIATAEALKQYNFMLEGVYRLLDARREELAAHTSAVENLRDYWIERSQLESLTGGEFSTASPAPTAPPETRAPQESHEHHNLENQDRHEHLKTGVKP